MSDTLANETFANLTIDDISRLDFSSLVGLVNEPNMPSGGGATIRRVIDLARLRSGSKILEVGSNTGFTCIEFASWTDCQVTGIDTNPISVAFATEKAERYGLTNVEFKVGDGRALPFEDGAFDLVYCSNVTSFIDDHTSARDEYYRVLSPNGILAAAPIYYHTTPPSEIVAKVGDAIGVDLQVTTQNYWQKLFSDPSATLVEQETYEYIRQSPERITEYVQTVFTQPHLLSIDPTLRAAAAERLSYFYSLFDENLTFAHYDILLYRRNHPNPEPVLHTSRRIGS